jgi:hypothetical protein
MLHLGNACLIPVAQICRNAPAQRGPGRNPGNAPCCRITSSTTCRAPRGPGGTPGNAPSNTECAEIEEANRRIQC